MDGMIKNLIRNYEFVFRVTTIENYLNPEIVKLEMRTWELTINTLPWGLKPNMFKNDSRAQNIVNHLKGRLEHYFSESSALIYSVARMYNLYTIKILKENNVAYNGMTIPRKFINQKRATIIQAIYNFSNSERVLQDKMDRFQNMAKRLHSVNKTEFETLYNTMFAAANEINGVYLNQFRSGTQNLNEEMKKVSESLADAIKVFKENHVKVSNFFLEILKLTEEYEWKMSRYGVHAVENNFTAVVRQAHDLMPVWQNVTKERLVELFTPASNFQVLITKYRRENYVLMNTLTKFEAAKANLNTIDDVDNAITAIQRDLPLLSVHFAAVTTNLLPLLRHLRRTFQDMFELIGRVDNAKYTFLQKFEYVLNEIVSFNKSLHIDDVMIRNNMLALQVFYQSLSLTEVVKSPAYTWFSLLSDVGGTAGLFLGGSFLTVLELVYFIGRSCRVPYTIAATKAKTSEVRSIDSNSTHTINTCQADTKTNVFSIRTTDSDYFTY
ncbi:uncharacterized protein LOC135501772 [Lineus longissimus]|uniref:uncharacterized protein LOC135501772 n=1 Tax=Lineus longissimus TaxID=88925 RepID=UPI00315D2289